jgi:hypothetical protein
LLEFFSNHGSLRYSSGVTRKHENHRVKRFRANFSAICILFAFFPFCEIFYFADQICKIITSTDGVPSNTSKYAVHSVIRDQSYSRTQSYAEIERREYARRACAGARSATVDPAERTHFTEVSHFIFRSGYHDSPARVHVAGVTHKKIPVFSKAFADTLHLIGQLFLVFTGQYRRLQMVNSAGFGGGAQRRRRKPDSK